MGPPLAKTTQAFRVVMPADGISQTAYCRRTGMYAGMSIDELNQGDDESL